MNQVFNAFYSFFYQRVASTRISLESPYAIGRAKAAWLATETREDGKIMAASITTDSGSKKQVRGMSESNSIKAVLRRLARSLYGTSRARRVSSSCVVETCEPRVLLATSVWSSNTGGSWFSAANWDGGVPDATNEVRLLNQNSGILTFEGRQANAEKVFVGSYLGPGRAILDLNGGRLTVKSAEIGGAISSTQVPGALPSAYYSYATLASTSIRNGMLTVEDNLDVGATVVANTITKNSTSQKLPYGTVSIGPGVRVDVGGTLSLGTARLASGYVYVYDGGKLTTDSVKGISGRAFVYGEDSTWLNDGLFSADVSVGAGGRLKTNTFTGELSLNGGTLAVRNYAPANQYLSSGVLSVAGGIYQSFNTNVPNGAAVTLENGTTGANLGPLTIGGQSLQTTGIVTVSSGSKIDWNSINLKRSGELVVSGSGTQVSSTTRISNPTPQMTVEGSNSQIQVLDGALLFGRELILRGSGSVSVR